MAPWPAQSVHLKSIEDGESRVSNGPHHTAKGSLKNERYGATSKPKPAEDYKNMEEAKLQSILEEAASARNPKDLYKGSPELRALLAETNSQEEDLNHKKITSRNRGSIYAKANRSNSMGNGSNDAVLYRNTAASTSSGSSALCGEKERINNRKKQRRDRSKGRGTQNNKKQSKFSHSLKITPTPTASRHTVDHPSNSCGLKSDRAKTLITTKAIRNPICCTTTIVTNSIKEEKELIAENSAGSIGSVGIYTPSWGSEAEKERDTMRRRNERCLEKSTGIYMPSWGSEVEKERDTMKRRNEKILEKSTGIYMPSWGSEVEKERDTTRRRNEKSLENRENKNTKLVKTNDGKNLRLQLVDRGGKSSAYNNRSEAAAEESAAYNHTSIATAEESLAYNYTSIAAAEDSSSGDSEMQEIEEEEETPKSVTVSSTTGDEDQDVVTKPIRAMEINRENNRELTECSSDTVASIMSSRSRLEGKEDACIADALKPPHRIEERKVAFFPAASAVSLQQRCTNIGSMASSYPEQTYFFPTLCFPGLGTCFPISSVDGLTSGRSKENKTEEEASKDAAAERPKSPTKADKMRARRNKKLGLLKQDDCYTSENVKGYFGDRTVQEIVECIELNLTPPPKEEDETDAGGEAKVVGDDGTEHSVEVSESAESKKEKEVRKIEYYTDDGSDIKNRRKQNQSNATKEIKLVSSKKNQKVKERPVVKNQTVINDKKTNRILNEVSEKKLLGNKKPIQSVGSVVDCKKAEAGIEQSCTGSEKGGVKGEKHLEKSLSGEKKLLAKDQNVIDSGTVQADEVMEEKAQSKKKNKELIQSQNVATYSEIHSNEVDNAKLSEQVQSGVATDVDQIQTAEKVEQESSGMSKVKEQMNNVASGKEVSQKYRDDVKQQNDQDRCVLMENEVNNNRPEKNEHGKNGNRHAKNGNLMNKRREENGDEITDQVFENGQDITKRKIQRNGQNLTVSNGNVQSENNKSNGQKITTDKRKLQDATSNKESDDQSVTAEKEENKTGKKSNGQNITMYKKVNEKKLDDQSVLADKEKNKNVKNKKSNGQSATVEKEKVGTLKKKSNGQNATTDNKRSPNLINAQKPSKEEGQGTNNKKSNGQNITTDKEKMQKSGSKKLNEKCQDTSDKIDRRKNQKLGQATSSKQFNQGQDPKSQNVEDGKILSKCQLADSRKNGNNNSSKILKENQTSDKWSENKVSDKMHPEKGSTVSDGRTVYKNKKSEKNGNINDASNKKKTENKRGKSLENDKVSNVLQTEEKNRNKKMDKCGRSTQEGGNIEKECVVQITGKSKSGTNVTDKKISVLAKSGTVEQNESSSNKSKKENGSVLEIEKSSVDRTSDNGKGDLEQVVSLEEAHKKKRRRHKKQNSLDETSSASLQNNSENSETVTSKLGADMQQNKNKNKTEKEARTITKVHSLENIKCEEKVVKEKKKSSIDETNRHVAITEVSISMSGGENKTSEKSHCTSSDAKSVTLDKGSTPRNGGVAGKQKRNDHLKQENNSKGTKKPENKYDAAGVPNSKSGTSLQKVKSLENLSSTSACKTKKASIKETHIREKTADKSTKTTLQNEVKCTSISKGESAFSEQRKSSNVTEMKKSKDEIINTRSSESSKKVKQKRIGTERSLEENRNGNEHRLEKKLLPEVLRPPTKSEKSTNSKLLYRKSVNLAMQKNQEHLGYPGLEEFYQEECEVLSNETDQYMDPDLTEFSEYIDDEFRLVKPRSARREHKKQAEKFIPCVRVPSKRRRGSTCILADADEISDVDSVHSLPVLSASQKVNAKKQSVSGGGTPKDSASDISSTPSEYGGSRKKSKRRRAKEINASRKMETHFQHGSMEPSSSAGAATVLVPSAAAEATLAKTDTCDQVILSDSSATTSLVNNHIVDVNKGSNTNNNNDDDDNNNNKSSNNKNVINSIKDEKSVMSENAVTKNMLQSSTTARHSKRDLARSTTNTHTILDSTKSEICVRDKTDSIRSTKNNIRDKTDSIRSTKNDIRDKTDPIRSTNNDIRDKTDPIRSTKNDIRDKTDPIRSTKNGKTDPIRSTKNAVTKPGSQMLNMMPAVVDYVKSNWDKVYNLKNSTVPEVVRNVPKLYYFSSEDVRGLVRDVPIQPCIPEIRFKTN